jgi:hypothetical protein
MLKSPLRKSLSVLSSLGLVLSLLIASQQVTHAEDIQEQCSGGYSPILAGRVVDTSGIAMTNIQIQSVADIDFGNENRSYVSSWGNSDQSGNYEICPNLSDVGLPAPSPVIGSTILFTAFDSTDASISINEFEVTSDVKICIESGGPCMFDLVLKRGAPFVAKGSSVQGNSSFSTFNGSLNTVERRLNDEDYEYTVVTEIASFSPSSSGVFKIYGAAPGEYRLVLFPNESDLLMDSAWQIVLGNDYSSVVRNLDARGDGDGTIFYNQPFISQPIQANNGIYELPFGIAKLKFMLTDGETPLSPDHIAVPTDYGPVLQFGSDSSVRFADDPACWQVPIDIANTHCSGNLDSNSAGEILAPWENGLFRFGANFGYNDQGVPTQFVMKIEDREITQVWRESGRSYDPQSDSNFEWTDIPLVNNQNVRDGLTLLPVDLRVTIAGEAREYASAILCPINEVSCAHDQAENSLEPSYGPDGLRAFSFVESMGVSCDSQVDGESPELQLTISPESWTPENSVATTYAVDCAGLLGDRTFAGYQLTVSGESRIIGEEVDLNNLVLKSAYLYGIVIGEEGEAVRDFYMYSQPIDSEGNYIQGSQLEIQRYYGSTAARFGKFNLSGIETGSYAIRFYVPNEGNVLSGSAGLVRLDVIVDSNGGVTSATYGNDLSAVPTQSALGDNGIELRLKSPNFRGTVLSQSGSPMPFIWFNVKKYNPDHIWADEEGFYNFDEANSVTSTNRNGLTAFYLPPGNKYRLVLPASGGQPKTDIDIWVDSDGDSCRLNGQTENDLCGDSAFSNWTLRYAEPNLTGTVTAGGNPVAAQVNVQKRNSSGWWEGTGDYISASDGEFAARLASSGYYRLELQPRSWSDSGQQPLEGYVQSFAYIKVDSSKRICIVPSTTDFDSLLQDCVSSSRELDADFALEESNLTIKVLAATTSGGELRPASSSGMDVREVTSNQFMGESFWANTNANGKAFLNLPESQGRTRFFEVTIRPPWNGNGLILASKVRKFCTNGDGNVYLVISETCGSTPVTEVLEIELAEGNVSGRIKTSDNQNLPTNSNSYAELRVWANTCPECNGNLNTWGWKWTNNVLNNSGNGTFGGDLSPGTYLVRASTWRSNYAPGAAIIRVGTNEDEHPWCLVAADAEALDIPEHNNAESKLDDALTDAIGNETAGVSDCDPLSNPATSLNVLLKAPNIQGTITDPNGTPIRNSWGQMYKITGVNDWNREYVSGMSVQSGRFVGRVKLPTSGTTTYGLQFEQPQGQEGSRFTIILTCTSEGCINAANSQASDSLSLSYPAPNFLGRICSPDSVDANPPVNGESATSYVCDAVKNSHLSIQTYTNGNWQWGNIWANTNSRGEVSLTLPNGTYRATAYPSWNNPKGVQTKVEFSIVGGVASFNPNVDKDSESETTLDIQLLGPNLTGTLKFQQGSETKIMQYGGISASLRCNNDCPTSWEDRWAWTSADRNGSYRLLLPSSGTWDVWVYANSSQNPKPPMRMIAVVDGDGDITSWDYASTVTSEFENPEPGEVNFDALPANLTVTITGTSEIRIVKFKDSQGNPINELTTYSSGGASNTISTRAPAGTYTVEVLRSSRQSTIGTSASVVVSSGNSVSTVSVSVN